MSHIDKADGLLAAYDMVMALHDEIEVEHCGTVSFLGFPRRRHHEIMGASRALRTLAKQLAEAHDSVLREAGE